MEQQDIKVSVAVITYNMEQYLEQLLDSILKQKVNFKYEIVIDDDASPDHSRDIIRKYQSKYRDIMHPIYRKKNVGGSRNMYGVMRRCKGEYIAILEGDDYWEADDKLQYQADFLDSHPEYIGMTCNSWCEHNEHPTYSHLMRNRKEPKVFTFRDFMALHFHDRLPSSTDTWMFRNFWHDGGDYSLFYKAHRMVWDQSLILILYGKGDVYADPIVVSHHRNIVRPDGTNYQSVIAQRNYLYDDSRMYQAMERYIEKTLKRGCDKFYEVRGAVWIDAIFRAIKTEDREDWRIVGYILRDQKRKGLLMNMFILKCIDIIRRKLELVL